MTYHYFTKEEFNRTIAINKYGKIYSDFINECLTKPYSKNLKKETGYEIHHIIPRACGGEDIDDNKIKLSVYDHILAHYYLTMGTDNIMMYHAFSLIVDRTFKKLSEIQQIKLSELKEWAKAIELSKKRWLTPENRAYLSKKTKERWAKWKENGRVDEIKQTISETTKQGMKESKTAQIRTRVNLGSKKYYNEIEDREMNWYPGMPEPDPKYWRRGRRPNSEESKKKLKETLNKHHKKFYHNDELKINTTFDDTEIIPEGWVIGQKPEYMGNNNKFKKKQQINTLNTLKKQTI